MIHRHLMKAVSEAFRAHIMPVTSSGVFGCLIYLAPLVTSLQAKCRSLLVQTQTCTALKEANNLTRASTDMTVSAGLRSTAMKIVMAGTCTQSILLSKHCVRLFH